MKYHIDVSSVLRRTVCDLYSNLVTRSTGEIVRHAIEEALLAMPEPKVTVIDFSQVTMIDFSCADEVVGKLLDLHQRSSSDTETYFLIRGVKEAHLEAIEASLERYDQAAIIMDENGSVQLVGHVDARARDVWQLVRRRGAVPMHDVEVELGGGVEDCGRVMAQLTDRRLVVRRADGYVALPQPS